MTLSASLMDDVYTLQVAIGERLRLRAADKHPSSHSSDNSNSGTQHSESIGTLPTKASSSFVAAAARAVRLLLPASVCASERSRTRLS